MAGKPMCVRGWTAGIEGVAAPSGSEQTGTQAKRLERRARGGESPVAGGFGSSGCRYVSTAGHEEPRGKLGRPRSKAKYAARPIVNEYREGKVKSTPARGVKQILKPSVYSQREHAVSVLLGEPTEQDRCDRVPIEE